MKDTSNHEKASLRMGEDICKNTYLMKDFKYKELLHTNKEKSNNTHTYT